MGINEEARKSLLKLFRYLEEGEMEKALVLAEQIYKKFGAAVGTLLDKKVSKGVVYAGKLWAGSVSVKEIKETLQQIL